MPFGAVFDKFLLLAQNVSQTIDLEWGRVPGGQNKA